MGWWSLGRHGGISGFLDDERADGKELDLIMGDHPADLMDNYLDSLINDEVPIPAKADLFKALVTNDFTGLPEQIQAETHKLRTDLWDAWRGITLDDEGGSRDPHPLEIQGCINFCQNERVNSIYEPPMSNGLELMKTW